MNQVLSRAVVVLIFLSVPGVVLLQGCSHSGRINDTNGDVAVRGRGTVVDVDGHVYKTVRIGTQWWMAEDLRATHFPDGTPIPDGSRDSGGSEESRYYRVVRNAVTSPVKSGEVVLYNWPAAVRAAPKGWHLPSLEEWQELEAYLGEQGPEALAPAMLGIGSPSGFDAELSGAWFRGEFMDNYTRFANFWSSTPVEDKSPPHAYCPHLSHESDRFLVNNGANVLAGWSVRYVRDEE